MDFPALFLPYKTVRHAPDLVCGMLRIWCATYSGFTVRHAPDYAHLSDENKKADTGNA